MRDICFFFVGRIRIIKVKLEGPLCILPYTAVITYRERKYASISGD